ncbi:ABC transporter substrate-binding protein [Synechococcus elongatus]
MQRSRSACVALMSTVLLASCQTQVQWPWQDPGGLKLGSLLPLTGDLAQYGRPMQDTAELLVETVNACGGVQGKPVRLIAADDETKPDRGVAAMTKLAEVDRVAGVVGAAASNVSDAALTLAVNNRVVMISPSSTSPRFTERARRGDFQGYWFRTAPSDALQGPALAKLALDQGWRSVSVIAINNDYGNGLLRSFIPAFEQAGGVVFNRDQPVLYTPDASSFDSEVEQAFRDRPDAVVLIGYPDSGALILKSAYEKGLLGNPTQVMLTDGLKTDQLAELVGRDPQGRYIVQDLVGVAPSSGGPGRERFLSLYEQRFQRDPQVFDANTWDAAALLVLAAEKSKSFEGEKLKESIAAIANGPGEPVSDICQALALVRAGKPINFQGASSELKLDNNGDVSGRYDFWQFDQTGKVKILKTESFQ